jgi:outer membrane protein assembly factor BamA
MHHRYLMGMHEQSRLLRPVIFLLLLMAWGMPLRAQTPSKMESGGSGKLTAIAVSGSKKYSSEQIASVSGLQKGATVRKEDFQTAANTLSGLGLFSSVRYKFRSMGEDVSVEFLVEDAPTVPVSFDNFPWFTDEELTQSLKQPMGMFDGSAPGNGAILDQMAEALSKLLATRGVTGTVEHTLVNSADGDSKVQQFHVTGSNLNVSGVQFSDELATKEPHIQERLGDIVGKPFSRFAMELFDFEQVRPIYLQHGNMRVHFGTPIARFTGDPSKPLASTVLVIVPIDPGPVYKFGNTTWSGNSAVPPDELTRATGLTSGEPADGMKIETAWDKVRLACGHHGYLDAKVDAGASFDEAAKTVSYKVSIVEGTQFQMGGLVLTGLSLEAERRLLAAWRLDKGAVFDRAYYEEFVAKGAKAAFGDLPFHYEKIGHWLRTNPQNATVDVLLDFQ